MWPILYRANTSIELDTQWACLAKLMYLRTNEHIDKCLTRVSHMWYYICHISMFYDVFTRYGHTIFGVPVTWCANAYNEYAFDEYLLYIV